MESAGVKKEPKFKCENCDFKCYKNSDWIRHIGTDKHAYRHDGNHKEHTGNLGVAKKSDFTCICGKNFETNSGLWKHKQKCKEKSLVVSNNNEVSPELIMELIKDNKELRHLVIEQSKTISDLAKCQNGNNNVTNINSHNKSFNLQFFLNETCKDAMNLMDFIDSIKLQLSDLEKIGELGYVEGISNIIVKNLKQLDISKRPVHCTDSKREVMYIKDDNKWEKEDDNKAKLKKAIKRVSNKNISLIPEFKAKYPDCVYSESKRSDQYNKIIVEAYELGDPEKQDKIIKKIAKEVVINKY